MELKDVRRTKWTPPGPGETIAVPGGSPLAWTDFYGNEWCICRKVVESAGPVDGGGACWYDLETVRQYTLGSGDLANIGHDDHAEALADVRLVDD